MVTEVGVVESTLGPRAKVKTTRTEACGQCRARGCCEMMGGGQVMLVEVDNPLGAKSGQRVQIAFETKPFLVATFLLYMVPILGLLAGVLAGQALGPKIGLSSQSGSVLAGLGLACLAAAFSWALGRRLSGRESYRPRVRRILGQDGEGASDGPAQEADNF